MSVRLITIPLSHFCEKARWALDRAAIDYQEEAHLPFFHYAHTLRLARSRTVPVLVHDGGVLMSSGAIVRWTDEGKGSLYPPARRDQVEALERRFDDRLGPASRLWAYSQLLDLRELAFRYASDGTPAWERAVLWRSYPIAARALRMQLGIDDDTIREAREEIVRVFDEVARMLDEGHRYLAGDTFTAADLTFATLAAPALLPEQYGRALPRVDELPAAMRLTIEGLRDHPAGEFALRLYAEHRKAGAQKP
jgi:glutathione S-transferase